MFGDVGVHRVDEAEFIDVLGDVGEQVTDPLAGFAVLLETEGAGEQAALGVPQRLAIDQLGPLAGVLLQQRLVVESVDLRGATGHEQLDQVLCSGSEVGGQRGQSVVDGTGHRCGGGRQGGVTDHAGQAQGAEAGTDSANHLASGQGGKRVDVMH